MTRHQLLVTLDVKPQAFDGYVAAMRAEEKGARSEPGNLGFDLWGQVGAPHVIWLLEFWASENALTVDHAVQPYYRHVRGLEAEALTGNFAERLLVERGNARHQLPASDKSLAAPIAWVTIWAQAPAALIATFDRGADVVRAGPGNCFWQLYANARRDGEMVLVEAWEHPSARAQAAQLPEAAAMHALVAQDQPEVVELRKL